MRISGFIVIGIILAAAFLLLLFEVMDSSCVDGLLPEITSGSYLSQNTSSLDDSSSAPDHIPGSENGDKAPSYPKDGGETANNGFSSGEAGQDSTENDANALVALDNAAIVKPAKPAALGSGQVTVWGYVKNQSGEPVPAADIEILCYIGSEGSVRGRCDEQGRFEFVIEANNNYILRAGATDFADTELHPLALDGEMLEVVLFKSKPLNGQVLETGSEQPVTHFTIIAGPQYLGNIGSPDLYYILKTQLDGETGHNLFRTYEFHSSDGTFEITDLPRREQMLLFVSAPGYLSVMVKSWWGRKGKPQIIHLSRGIEITGTVRDGSNKQTLPGAMISVFDFDGITEKLLQQTVAGEEGRFSINLGNKRRDFGSQKVVFCLDGYGKLTKDARELRGHRKNIINLYAGAKITVRVINPDNTPVPGALVRIADRKETVTFESALTPSWGELTSDRLAPGNYRVVVYFEKAVDPDKSFAAQDVMRMDKHITLKNEEDVVVEFIKSAGATVSGQFCLNGKAQARAKIILRRGSGWKNRGKCETQTGTDGRYELKNLSPGAYSLQMNSHGSQLKKNLNLQEHTALTFNCNVSTVNIEGQVKSSQPLPAKSLRIFWKRTQKIGGYNYTCRTYTDKQALFSAQLAEGLYKVEIYAGKDKYILDNISVSPDEFIILPIGTDAMFRFVLKHPKKKKVRNYSVVIHEYKNNTLIKNAKEWERGGIYYRQFDFSNCDRYLLYFVHAKSAPYGPVEILRGMAAREIIIPLERGIGSIVCNTMDIYGKLLTGLVVYISKNGEEAAFDWKQVAANSRARFRFLPTGYYNITCAKSGYHPFESRIGLSAEANQQVVEIKMHPK
ncbi:hypothetical protein ACFL54_06175 [Planctomycetota bacterium]